MFKKLFTYLLHGNRFHGIELTSESLSEDKGNAANFHLTSLKKKNKEINTEVFFETNDIARLTERVPANSGFFLVVNNEQVLTKRIESAQKEDLRLINQAFPNIDNNGFYYEILSSEDIHFVSICRKNYVDGLIESFKNKKLHVYGLSLDNNITTVLGQYVNKSTLTTSNAKITFDGNQISTIEKTQALPVETYDINSLSIDNHHILSFSGALAVVLGYSSLKTNLASKIHENQEDYKQVRFFNHFSKAALAFLLTVLIINFLFFNQYYNEVNQLRQTAQVNQTNKEKMAALNNELAKTQTMVSDMFKSNSSRSSFYANNIVQSLPASVLLHDLDFQPLQKRIKEGELIENNKNTILIAGHSTNSKSFSQWIAAMEAINWVQKVEIIDYADVSESMSTFAIKLTIDDEQ